MQKPKGKPTVVPSSGGRKMIVLGMDVTLKLATAESGGDFYVFEASTPPGMGVPPHVHKHEDEVIQVIDGEFEIFLDGKTHKATQGAVINFPHSFLTASAISVKSLGGLSLLSSLA